MCVRGSSQNREQRLVRALRLCAERDPPPAEGSEVARGDLQLNLSNLFSFRLLQMSPKSPGDAGLSARGGLPAGRAGRARHG